MASAPSPTNPGILAVVGQSNGISLRRASAKLAAADELERGGFATWRAPARARRRRFVLTVRGWAKLVETGAAPCAGEFWQSDQHVKSHAEAETCP